MAKKPIQQPTNSQFRKIIEAMVNTPMPDDDTNFSAREAREVIAYYRHAMRMIVADNQVLELELDKKVGKYRKISLDYEIS